MEFNIGDIANIYGIRPIKEQNGEIFAVCPFCGNKKGKFSYLITKGNKSNLYNCWSCGESGSMFDLYRKLSDKSYDEHDYKAMSRDIYKALDNGVSNFVDYTKFKNETNESDRREDEYLHKVYKAFLSLLTLKNEHKQDLVRRGLSEKIISAYGFKSIPTNKEGICKKLISKGYSLKGVPGFYQKANGDWTINAANGYLCPLFNHRNLVGFQVRSDNPKNNCKYVWLSSTGKENGCSSGGRSNFLLGRHKDVFIITEGILKATIIYELLNREISVVGVPGVNAIKDLKNNFDYFENAFVFEAYDMDKALNYKNEEERKKTENIFKASIELKRILNESNINNFPIIWDYDENRRWKGNFKGLDDFLYVYTKKHDYMNFVKYLLEKSKRLLNIQKNM